MSAEFKDLISRYHQAGLEEAAVELEEHRISLVDRGLIPASLPEPQVETSEGIVPERVMQLALQFNLECGASLGDKVSLLILQGWNDIYRLRDDKSQSSYEETPEYLKFYEFMDSLSPREKAKISHALGRLRWTRPKMTVGELRRTSFQNLLRESGVGIISATILHYGLKAPERKRRGLIFWRR